MKNGERQGFEIVTLDGQTAILASKDIISNVRVGKYGVNIQNLEQTGVPAIEQALREKEIVVIDEIGNMQIASKNFCETVEQALQSNRIVLATIHIHDHPFTNTIKVRKDVELFVITQQNRNRIREKIVNAIQTFNI